MLAVTGKHPCREYPPKGKLWVVHKADNIWHIEGEGRQWQVQFKSSDAGRAKFQGEAVDGIWFDEEPLKIDIWTECMRALIDRGGNWWMTATPILGSAWLKALSEKPDVFVTTGAMWDNPYLPLDEVKREAADLSEDERLVRIEGQYIVFGGSPVFNIRILTKMIDGLRQDVPTSTGTLEVVAA
jgi:phage terminase large subunit-like protein